MNGLTIVFPIIIALFILLFYLGCPTPGRAELNSCGRRSFNKRDALTLGLIVIIYSAVAFYNLGDTTAPQSFHRFESGEIVVLDLESEQTVSSVMFYDGLGTGSYTLEYSHDGEYWYKAAELSQDYASLFKWISAEFVDGIDAQTRYIRICANDGLYLGEVAVEGENGELLKYRTDAIELCDEQSVVPDYQYYLNSTYFDEIYHARTAYEHIQGVYPYEISHPPLGKLIIAIGIKLFGMTPFGWRFSGVVFGIGMLPVLYTLLKKMFGGIAVPACGTAIFAFDFMHYTQTRIATIDTYAVFFILLMYLFMYLYVNSGRLRHLALSGVFFGIGVACKWTCLYAGAGLAVIWLIYRIGRLKDNCGVWEFFKNCLFCLVFFVILPCLIYYVSYFAYATASGMHGGGMFFTKEYADIVIENQKFMFTYHSGVHSEHPYSSRWYQWVLDIRPILYYLLYFNDGSRSSFGAFLNPVLCWAGLVAVFLCAYLAIVRRDKPSAFIVIGYLAQLLPWVFITRTTFEYHYFPSAVFLTLALCRVFALMRTGTKYWRTNVYGLTVLSLILFAVFYPVLSGQPVNSELATRLLKWLPSWPF